MTDNTQELDVILRQYPHLPQDEIRHALLDWHKQEIAKAKIDEWNRLISITRINGERVINQATYSLALDRIAELSGRKDRATKTGAEEK